MHTCMHAYIHACIHTYIHMQETPAKEHQTSHASKHDNEKEILMHVDDACETFLDDSGLQHVIQLDADDVQLRKKV
jgi:hypothetical protein